MRERWIAPSQLFDAGALSKGIALRVVDGQVLDVESAPENTEVIEGIVTPGFVDLQVNGGGGVLFNGTPFAAGIAHIAAAHRRFGTVAILPTVITDTPEVMDQAAAAVLRARDQVEVLGLHTEGPHISVAKRGTHKEEHIRAMDRRTMELVAHLQSAGVQVMITVAPEATSLEQINVLSELGVIVSIGHTDASADQAEAAFEAGVTCATHLFNAMSQIAPREPGVVGAVLSSSITDAGMICDGHHVDVRTARVALRAKSGQGAVFAVSDAMATVGGPDHFELYGETISVEDGKLVNAEGVLSGAHITLLESVSWLVEQVGISLEEALAMVVTVPSKVIGREDLGTVVGRSTDDVMVLAEDLSLRGCLSDVLAQEIG